MRILYTNRPNDDWVINPFKKYLNGCESAFLAAPYFTLAEPIIEASKHAKQIQLLVELNSITCPKALSKLNRISNVSIRYLTGRFHAKIYIFDEWALVGSSNLTDGGMLSNREAVILLGPHTNDSSTIDEVRTLFQELWDSGAVLTDQSLKEFERMRKSIKSEANAGQVMIENTLGKIHPINLAVSSQKKTRERLFLDNLNRQIFEQYKPAFDEVAHILNSNNLRKNTLANVGFENEINRFLNWVRLKHVKGDEAWQNASILAPSDRILNITEYGNEWVKTENDFVSNEFYSMLESVNSVFSAESSINLATKEELTNGLLSVHAFLEQLRFVKGGYDNLPKEFWAANKNDVIKVKASLKYLIHGGGNFSERLHDMLHEPKLKLGYFGYFCALELFGTVRPEICPPMNNRIAKALKFLGYEVRVI